MSAGGVAVIPDRLVAAAGRLPLYRWLSERGVDPEYRHTAEDLETLAATHADPFAGRHDVAHEPAALIQATRDLPVYWALTARDLAAMSRVLAAAWTALGITAGERVALYDYATSPLVLYASRAYVPHLDAGAADLLGCLPLCNDGLPDLADRCAHVLEYFQPSTLFVDAELMSPLARALKERGTSTAAAVVVTADECVAGAARLAEWRSSLGTAVTQMLRADAALFFAPPCPSRPMTFHPDAAAYCVEALDGEAARNADAGRVVEAGRGAEARRIADAGYIDSAGRIADAGRIAVTNVAIEASVVVRYVTAIAGTVHDGVCPCGVTGPAVTVSHGD